MQQTRLNRLGFVLMAPKDVKEDDELQEWLNNQALDVSNIEPLREALTHTSAGRSINHEELEFLGDAVLRLAATQYLRKHQQTLSVGQKSELRAWLVSDRWLATFGHQNGMLGLIKMGEKGRQDTTATDTILAEITEAMIGALFISSGIETVLTWLTPHWDCSSAEMLHHPERFNSKSSLQEYSQGLGHGLPVYATEQISQQHGDPRRFRSIVCIAGETSAEGFGKSRKDAEQQAAREALALIRHQCSAAPSTSSAVPQ